MAEHKVVRERDDLFYDLQARNDYRKIFRSGIAGVHKSLLVQILHQIFALFCRQAAIQDRFQPISFGIRINPHQSQGNATDGVLQLPWLFLPFLADTRRWFHRLSLGCVEG